MLATQGQKTKTGISSTIIYKLGFYANFPRPWPDEAAEVAGIQQDKWLPASEDFDTIGPATTNASQATKPYAQAITTLDDIIVTVNYFAPKVPGFSTSHPSRVQRLNLFFYSGGQNLEFSGTLQTNGLWVSIFGPTLDLDATVVDTNVISNVQGNSANTPILEKTEERLDNRY